jgi:type III secretion protein Q
MGRDMLALAAAPRPLDVRRWAARRVSRVERVLARRGRLIGELTALTAGVSAALTEALAVPVSCEARLRASPEPRGRALALHRAPCLFHLDGPDVAAILELELRFVVGLVAHLTGAPAPTTPVLALTGFERAVLAHLLLVALGGLREQPTAEGRWRPRLVGVVPPGQEAETALGRQRLLGVELELRAGDRAGDARLLVPEAAVQTVALSLDVDAPRPTGAAREARFAFRPRARCGVVWPSELHALRPGAAVVLPGLRCIERHLQGPLQLVRAGAVLGGELTAGGWALGAIDSSPLTAEVTCVDPQLSTLPVELEVELARVPLTLVELAALAPGMVLPLRISVGDPVFLRAGDRRVARAELVDLEGEVAARVLDVLE